MPTMGKLRLHHAPRSTLLIVAAMPSPRMAACWCSTMCGRQQAAGGRCMDSSGVFLPKEEQSFRTTDGSFGEWTTAEAATLAVH